MVTEVAGDDWFVVDRLWQLYAHDLSELRGWLPGPEGEFVQTRVPAYAGEPGRGGYLALLDGAPVGFALVRGLDADATVLGELFVVRAARRRGVGGRLAREVLGRHPGTWEVAFQEENVRAARLWRTTWRDVFAEVSEELRPAPGRPDLPPDTWLVGR